MAHKLSHLLLLSLVAAGLSGCTIYETNSFSDYERGAKAAARDIARGKYKRLDGYGIIGPGSEEMQEILKRRYGIGSQTDPTAGGDYAKGYNSMMNAASKARFGDDYYEKAIQESWKSQPESGRFGLTLPVADESL